MFDGKCNFKIIPSIIEPKTKRFDFMEMHDFFYEKRLTIYPGKVNDYDSFRMSNIKRINYFDIQRFFQELKVKLKSIIPLIHFK